LETIRYIKQTSGEHIPNGASGLQETLQHSARKKSRILCNSGQAVGLISRSKCQKPYFRFRQQVHCSPPIDNVRNPIFVVYIVLHLLRSANRSWLHPHRGGIIQGLGPSNPWQLARYIADSGRKMGQRVVLCLYSSFECHLCNLGVSCGRLQGM
jgi:hypothetical protein